MVGNNRTCADIWLGGVIGLFACQQVDCTTWPPFKWLPLDRMDHSPWGMLHCCSPWPNQSDWERAEPSLPGPSLSPIPLIWTVATHSVEHFNLYPIKPFKLLFLVNREWSNIFNYKVCPVNKLFSHFIDLHSSGTMGIVEHTRARNGQFAFALQTTGSKWIVACLENLSISG